MSRSLLILSALALVAAPAAHAEPAVASKSDARGIQALQNVGHCVAHERGAMSAEFVTIDYRSDRYRALSKKLGEVAAHCNDFRRGLRASGLIFAGAIAEGLLIEQGLLEDLATHTRYDPEAAPLEANSAEEVMAYCVVRKAPAEVSALLNTEMTSDEELAQLKAMAGVLPTCVPQGQSPQFTREALRALIALSAYRLHAHAQGEGGEVAGS